MNQATTPNPFLAVGQFLNSIAPHNLVALLSGGQPIDIFPTTSEDPVVVDEIPTQKDLVDNRSTQIYKAEGPYVPQKLHTSIYGRQPITSRRMRHAITGSEVTRRDRSITKGIGDAYNDEFSPTEQSLRVDHRREYDEFASPPNRRITKVTAGVGSAEMQPDQSSVIQPYPFRLGAIQIEGPPDTEKALEQFEKPPIGVPTPIDPFEEVPAAIEEEIIERSKEFEKSKFKTNFF